MRSHVPVLTALGESLVKVSTDDALIELGTANVLHAVERILMAVVFDEAETAGSLLVAVQTHDEALDLTASCVQCQRWCCNQLIGYLLREKLVDLLLSSVEGPA